MGHSGECGMMGRAGRALDRGFRGDVERERWVAGIIGREIFRPLG